MVYEVAPFSFDVAKLREHLEKHVLALPPATQSTSFGGWSVLSSTGSYLDGWQKGYLMIQPDMTSDAVRAALRAAGVPRSQDYNQPTEICHGYLREFVDTLIAKGLNPRRARIIRLRGGSASSWHRDWPDNIYAVRLHVPIVTNPGAIFETETESAHLAADGSAYFLKVNRIHRVRNGGTEDRFHLVTDVWDTRGLSQFHKYDGPLPSSK